MNRTRWAAFSAVAALAAVSLAGCKKEGVVAKDESVESVAKKLQASDIKPRPGRWESRMKLETMELPNMPPQAKAAMDKQMGVTQTFVSCLTPEQVSKPDAGFFQKGAQDCKYDHFVMSDGKLDSAMTCKQGNQQVRMTMTGAYGTDSYDIQVKSQGEMQPGMPMSMAMTISSRRVGDCNGSEEK